MPILINELVFKGTIGEPAASEKRPPAAPPQPVIDQDTLVQVCVEEVLKALERLKER
jgi:hypothetical protein